MSDPLSIAASVAGLITLAGAIYSSVSSFIERVENAPQFAHTIVMEVSITRMTLAAMSDLIDGFLEQIALRRRAMVNVDCLVLTVTNAVVAFSDLEAFLSGWPAIARMPYAPLQRIRWSLQEERAQKLVARLADARSGLSLVLNIFQCSSDLVAAQSRDTLQASVNRLLEDNLEFRASLMGSSSTIRGPRLFQDSVLAIDSRPVSRAASIKTSVSLLHKPFENVLYKTRVYSRVKSNSDCDKSLHTDLVSTHLGSTYTGITLDRISIISVVALPLPWSSIINTKWYKQRKLHSVDESSETSRPASSSPLKYKIAVVGGPATGKSALAFRFCNGEFQARSDSCPTIEDRYQKDLLVNGQDIKLEIIDTAGADEYEHSRKGAIEEADGVIITFSIHKAREFDSVERIHSSLKATYGLDDSRPIVLVGTGADAGDLREVGVARGRALATRLGCGFIECSAVLGRNVDAPFLYIVERLSRPLKKRSRLSDASGLKLLGWEEA